MVQTCGPAPALCPLCGDGLIRVHNEGDLAGAGHTRFACTECPYHGLLPASDETPLGTMMAPMAIARRPRLRFTVDELLRP